MSPVYSGRAKSRTAAEDQDTLVPVHQELRRSKPRSRRDQIAGKAIKAISGDRVAGLFDFDLDPLPQRSASHQHCKVLIFLLFLSAKLVTSILIVR